MDMALIKDIFEVCIIPLLGVLTAYLVKWISVQSEELAAKAKNEM